jgi:hypothetical protein
MEERKFTQLQYLGAGAVTLFTLIVYVMTAAPTFSYWDCGEFVACSWILGVPHPPGTPLFVLIGRIFSVLPLSSDIGTRINFISSFSSAIAAGIAFLLLARLIRGTLSTNDQPLAKWQQILTICGSVSGSLFMAFSFTHWNNAVEAEVYGASMFLMLLLCWLTLRWIDNRHKTRGNRYLIAIAYFGLLSLGIHMTVFLAMPVIFLLIIMVDPELRKDWRFWVTGLTLFLVTSDVLWFFICAGVWLLITLGMALTRRARGGWALFAAMMFSAWLGYSCQLYLPIRSHLNPNIDENDPETFAGFRSFVERKQYGQTGMFERMFKRRGTWTNQFGDHAHMGFYRCFRAQYGFDGWPMVPVMALGFFGVWWMIRRRPPWGVFVMMLFLLGSVGLVLYMNFADGTQYYRLAPDAYMEVRDRDYFFTPGFIVFGLMMGLGLTALGELVVRRWRKPAYAIVIGVIAALLPLHTLQANWRGADRSRNYTPYDYAYDLLQSCGPKAILFTGGDNDTFPLWCIQEVYGVRRDVSIVNLSLAQTDWYVYQMKHRWGLPVTLTDDQILWTVEDKSLGPGISRPKEPYYDPVSKSRHYLFATRDGEDVVGPAEMIVEHIFMNNHWERPIYFSGSPAGKSRLGLEKHTRMVGGAFEIVREDANYEFDYEKTAALMDTVFKFRGYNTPLNGLDDNAVGLAMSFPEKMLAIAEYYHRRNDTLKWDYWNRKAVATFPFYARCHSQLADQLKAQGDSAGAQEVLRRGIDTIGAYARETPDDRLYWLFWGKACESAGRQDEAFRYLAKAYYMNPYDQMTYQSYINNCLAQGKSAAAAVAARKWLEYFPDDNQARSLASAPPSRGSP